MVAVEVKRWHPLMLLAQVLTLLVYMTALVALSSPMLDASATVDIKFILTWDFCWKVAALTIGSTVPIFVVKIFAQWCMPSIVSLVN